MTGGLSSRRFISVSRASGDADPAVADLDQHAPAGYLLTRDVHRGVPGGEDRGVLDNLGQQVHDVGHPPGR